MRSALSIKEKLIWLFTKTGKDSEGNFALTHESCNKFKQDTDLRVARTLAFLKQIQEETHKTENSSASLKHILMAYNGDKYKFEYSFDGGINKCHKFYMT